MSDQLCLLSLVDGTKLTLFKDISLEQAGRVR